jgi:hypothetical protein
VRAAADPAAGATAWLESTGLPLSTTQPC